MSNEAVNEMDPNPRLKFIITQTGRPIEECLTLEELKTTFFEGDLAWREEDDYHEHALVTQTRGELLTLYAATSNAHKAAASKRYPWLVAQFKKAPDWEHCWREARVCTADEWADARPNEFPPHTPFIRRQQGRTTLHPVVLESYHMPSGEGRSGLEMVLAVAFRLNPKFEEAVASGVAADAPIPGRSVACIALGDGETSGSGVYGVRNKNGKFRIGSTCDTLAAHLGCGPDNRLPANKHILFNLAPLRAKLFSIQWLAHALETLTIVAFETHNPRIGTNTRAATQLDGSETDSMAYRTLIEWWDVMERATLLNGAPILPLDTADNYNAWVGQYLAPSFLQSLRRYHLQPRYVPGLEVMREVSRLADLGVFEYLEPLPSEANKPEVRYNIPRYEGEAYLNGFPRVVGEIYKPDPILADAFDRFDVDALYARLLEKNGGVPPDWGQESRR